MQKKALLAFGLVVISLMALGLIVLSSASAPTSFRETHELTAFHYYMRRQFMYCAAGLILAAVVAWFDYRKFREYPWFTVAIYAAVIVLLVVVLFSDGKKGSQRWVKLFGITIQPGELAKIMAVLVTAVCVARAGWRVELFKYGVAIPGCYVAGLLGLTLAEPDYGSAGVILCAAALVMFVGGVRWRHIVPAGVLGLALIAALVVLNSNRMKRLGSQYGEDGMTYQTRQSLSAFANGGLWGVGYHNSMQKHAYLPENYTDFVFAIGAEEFGMPLSILTVSLFFALFLLSVYIAKHSQDRLGKFIALGMGTLIFSQAMYNLGMICDSGLPVKGMALPFFSYGGSNMICTCAEAGLILSVGFHAGGDAKRRHLQKALMQKRSADV